MLMHQEYAKFKLGNHSLLISPKFQTVNAQICAFPVNSKLLFSANAFWTVSCTVNSQDKTAICLSSVTIKRKVSSSGFQTRIGAFTKNNASCHSVLFSNFSAATPGQWYERLNVKESFRPTPQLKRDKSAKQAQCRKLM